MRLLDRITGQDLSVLPEVMHSGRYLLRQDAVLNRHTSLKAGDVLCSDGADRCQLGDIRLSFVPIDQALAAKGELFGDAITTITGLMSAGVEMPSPLLPSAMINEQGRLTPLERMLCEVLKTGHLHSISTRPRIDLKYEEAVTDVARARRLTTGTYTHLASHSECWQRQTLSGVQPRRVLARFSEDDYATYENRVYARLLDGLDNYLTQRLQRLEALRDDLEQALRFTGSKSLHFRLIRAICALWGQTYDAGQTKLQLDATLYALEKIGSQLTSIRGLKQTGLYLLVPRSLRLGASLHRTNILTHDQHYRHLALLWDELQHSLQISNRTPAEILAANQKLELNYSRYVGLILSHALLKYGSEVNDGVLWAGHQLQTVQSGLEWHLKVDGAVVLELVPWARLGHLPDDAVQLGEHRIVCWPGVELGDALESALTGSALRLSPMDLYTVERLGALIDGTLSRILLGHYGKSIQPLPAAVAIDAEHCNGLKVQGNSLQVLAPLGGEAAQRVQALFDKHARRELSQAFIERLAGVRTLSMCPVCDVPAELSIQADDGFSSKCSSCGCKRYWRKSGADRWVYQQVLGELHDFRLTGRRSMAFSLQR
ncbi:hypothetical protein U8047_006526 [Pseudomonas aeruginosa]|uniref:hypothetical protein n=1 Tax=Pseudomonas aeruginosa TaxID=287 RepID=UPI0011EB648D|nr:hypothetical protein [Pseudomonas aeruginosa]EMB2825447.1 hypothetical protein [Pseudomonas aeruginosa]TYT30189.1 hypothetical protein FZC29_33005 [Pseudomonas aeruginosa]